MAKYVDGFVIPVSKDKIGEYRKMAKMGAKLWKKYGALEYFECVGDDLSPKMGGGIKFMKFPQLVKAKPGETVVFSFIVYKSRAHRDAVNAKVMKDPMMSDPAWKNKPMPFDMKRMAYGGFKSIVEF
ncbi:MAG: RNA signal recognition particle [Candidatus Moranbacteria bacterium RIFOXYA12_FULL_44_15]|nr:MAG: RNA signal recognition particle [Candidatus Moranbacteria bacterium RIFOXYA12_FULL_44_15]OGI34343.1 MAG: RNA signal recognition particle [Candidatus Moranbacteria bacterium RIFOXYA2_FULL_43_15]